MSDKQFISNLSSTYADVRKLDVKKIASKVIDSKKILLNDKNIEELWGLNLPEDYTKFITRCELPEDENWSLWSDTGNLIYMNFSNKIINGYRMFYYYENLTTFTFDLSSLTNGTDMFNGCSNLTSFTSDVSSLTNGNNMFNSCSNLTTFISDLSSLTDGTRMFNSCSNLNTFTSDLSSLTDGTRMFSYCSNLTTFISDLSSLTDGTDMFRDCKLDSNSIENILTTIPTITTNNTLRIDIQESAASKFTEITGLTPGTAIKTVSYKGWSVKVKINK